jgi:hypothetical protein
MTDNELKQRFFAQYLGCRVVITNEIGKFQFCLKAVDIGIEMPCIVDDCFLILKDLSTITDGEANEVGDLLNYKDEDYIKKNLGDTRASKVRRDLASGIFVGNFYRHLHVMDLLRSRGYLVPFMHLSIQDILDRGWAKYAQ